MSDAEFSSFVADAQQEARLISDEDDDEAELLSAEELLWRNRARMAVAIFVLVGGVLSVLIGFGALNALLGFAYIIAGILQAWLGFAIWRRRVRAYRIMSVISAILILAALFYGTGSDQTDIIFIVVQGLNFLGLHYSRMTFDC